MHLLQSKWLVDNRELNLQLQQRSHFFTFNGTFPQIYQTTRSFFTRPCISNGCSIDLSDLPLFLTQYMYEKTAETVIVRKQTAHSLSKFCTYGGPSKSV